MKKTVLSILLFITVLATYAQQTRSNCPVKEETFTRVLPDGRTITLFVFGSEMIQYFETVDGYTVLERADGFYEYAQLNPTGDLVFSGVLVKEGNAPSAKNLAPHLRYSPAQINAMAEAFSFANQNLTKKAGGKPFPSKGKRNVLTLLIQYPDLNASLPKSNFDSLMVKPNYNGTGSFRDYYLKASYGQLELNVDVFGWYNATSGYINYGKSNTSYMSNVGNLVKRAILAADSAGVDFSKYDNDSDGFVDGIIIMHAGIGAEEQSAPNANNYIWSHRYNLSYTVGSVNLDGVVIDSYGIFPEKRYNGGSYTQVGIGVISHEFGHLLDLPDLYSTQSNGEGAGNYAIMAGGPWLNNEKTPCMQDAWSRIALGWMTPTVISASGTYTIPKSLVDSNFAFKINTSQANEYFLLENRQKRGFDAYIPSKGLAVWHINTNKARVLSQASNNVNNDTSAYGVGLLQADGRRDLEKGNNRGDAGDLYPGNTTNRNISSSTNPNSSLHYKIGGIKQASNMVISNITMNPDSSITFTIGNKPTASFDPMPIKGCAPLFVNFNNGSSFANNYLWKFSDGTTSTEKSPNKTFDTAGTYTAQLLVLDSLGSTVDSSTKTVTVDFSPTSDYSMERGDSNTFTLVNNSKNALYVVWKFGSNQSSTSPNLKYTITGNTDIPFMLIAYSQNLCSDTSFGVLSYWPLGLKPNQTLDQCKVYPNPFEKEFSLDLNLNSSLSLSLKLRDVLGKIIWEKASESYPAGYSKLNISVPEIQTGVYFLTIEGTDINKILRVNSR